MPVISSILLELLVAYASSQKLWECVSFNFDDWLYRRKHIFIESLNCSRRVVSHFCVHEYWDWTMYDFSLFSHHQFWNLSYISFIFLSISNELDFLFVWFRIFDYIWFLSMWVLIGLIMFGFVLFGPIWTRLNWIDLFWYDLI